MSVIKFVEDFFHSPTSCFHRFQSGVAKVDQQIQKFDKSQFHDIIGKVSVVGLGILLGGLAIAAIASAPAFIPVAISLALAGGAFTAAYSFWALGNPAAKVSR